MTFLDPVTVAKQSEAEGRLPSVFPEEFFYKYREQPDGSQKQEEWVLVAKKGMTNPQRTPMRWKDIERDPALLSVLEPYYKNWKKGETAPINGTPLEAWVADVALIKVLNSVNVRSVEDFAQLEDHLLVKLNLPNAREKKSRAIAFLQAQQSTSKVSAEVTELRGKNESLSQEIAELKALIEKHAIAQTQPQPVPVQPITTEAAPKKKGWPKGKPRKPKENVIEPFNDSAERGETPRPE